MKNNKFIGVSKISGILFLVLAVVIFVFAEGLRRWYSGIFFTIIGSGTILNALRLERGTDE